MSTNEKFQESKPITENIIQLAEISIDKALLVKRRRRTPMQASGHARRRRWFS